MTGQCNFSIAPAIYHFLILYISFANLKNFNFLRLHQHRHNPQFSQSAGFIYLMYNLRILLWYRSFTLETDVPLFLPTSLLNVRFEAGLSDWKNLTEPNIVHSCNAIHCSVHHILLWVKLPNESPNFKEQWWLSWTLHVATSWSGWLGRGQQA